MKAEPLLFIDTINNDNVIPKNQQLFDSRNKQIKIITKTQPPAYNTSGGVFYESCSGEKSKNIQRSVKINI